MKKVLLTLTLLSCTFFVFSQNRAVKGTVRDATTSKPLVGVTITSSGSTTSSNSEGKYNLALPLSNETINYSLLGYRDTLIRVGPHEEAIDILLLPSSEKLEDVIITGYTRESRARITGSLSKIDGETVSSVPVASLDQVLQGRVPGLYVASPSGLPGTPGRVTIRGIASLQDENTVPLYIVDGVPVEPTSISTLNPEDFESYTVLKDAASTAQYGSRAANGVIVITTKKGRNVPKGRTFVNYNNQFGFSNVNFSKWNMMNVEQRLRFEEILEDPELPGWRYSRNNPNKLDGSPKSEDDFIYGDQILNDLRGRNNDFNKKMLRSGFTQAHNLNLSRHSEETSYYLSGGYFHQEGVLYNSGLKRYNLRSNIQHISGNFQMDVNLGLGYIDSRITEDDFDVSETNPVAALYFTLPYENLFNTDGSLATGTNQYGSNALSMYQDINRKKSQLKSLLSTNISYQLTPEIKLKSTIGVDYQQDRHVAFIRPDSYLGSLVEQGERGSYENEYVSNFGVIATGGVSYNKTWSSHDLEVNALAEINERKLNNSGFTGYGLIPGLENTPGGITQGTADNSFIPFIMGGQSKNRLISQIGLLRYTNSNKYTFTASLRNDGTSRVPSSNRYQLFYAFGGAWNVSEENFAQDITWLSNLRLRGSYGKTGNASGFASDFGYRGLYGKGNYGGMPSLIPVYPSNPAYTWEVNHIADIGVEFGLLDNKLRGGFDFYNRVTSNLFLQKLLSFTSGFESMNTNSGKIRNRGVELFLEGDIIKNEDFSFTAGINLGYNKNKVQALGGNEELITDDYSINKVGMPIGQFYMVRWSGVDANDGAPIYLDRNGDPTKEFDPDNAVPVKGSFDPPLKGGVPLSIRYKNISLSTLFTFIKGMYRLNTAEFLRTSADVNYRQYNQSPSMLDIWQKPGDITEHPSAKYPRFMTDRELQNADYIKLRNFRVDYNIPMRNKSKDPIQTLRLFVQGQNLFTWTKFKAFDPEDDNNWYEYEYPLPRTITAGFNFSF